MYAQWSLSFGQFYLVLQVYEGLELEDYSRIRYIYETTLGQIRTKCPVDGMFRATISQCPKKDQN